MIAASLSSRRRYIDWARGIAVLIMIQAHALDAWTRHADRRSLTFGYFLVLGGFAAPMFLWLAGLGLVLSAERVLEKTGRRSGAAEAIVRRGAEIFILAFLFRIQAFIISPGSSPVTLFRVDILNVMAARDGVLASAIARAVAAFDRQLILFGPPDSELVRAGEAAGLRVAAEGFADRAYESDGSLVSRTKPGAVIAEADEVVKRAVKIARDHSVVAVNGATVSLRVETLCVHSDTEGADVLAARVRTGLEAAGIVVKSIVDSLWLPTTD